MHPSSRYNPNKKRAVLSSGLNLLSATLLATLIAGCFPQKAPPTPPTDSDGDGVYDHVDVCPNGDINGENLTNADQTDTDGDGMGELCDALPNDFDNDGWTDDGTDKCPTIADPSNNDPALCTDTDGDTVLDSTDNCITRQNVTQDIAVCADPDADLVYNVAADDMPGEIIDNCPDRANASQNANVCADPDGDKLFNAAADNDSVVDACPTIVNPGNNPAYCEDSDGDGVYNLIAAGQTHAPGDNCPNGDGNGAQMLNADQTDDDGDGIGNICDGPGFVDNDNDLLDDNTEDTCVGVKRADNNPAACTDTDGDLVMNLGDDNGSASDNCPTRKNASQNADVCADPDGDTVFTKAADDSAEVDDNCPAIPNADQAANIGFQVTKGDACDNEDNDATVDLTDPCPVEGSVTDCANQDLAELWDDYYIDFMCWANKVDGRNSCAPPDGLAAVDNRSMTCPGGGSFKWNVGSDGKNEQIWSNCTFTLGQVDYRGAGVYPATHTVTVNGSNLGMMDACASCDDQGTGQINGNYTITATYSKAGKTRTYTDAKVKEDRYVYRKKVVANDHVKNAGTTLSQTDCVETSKGCVTGKVIYDNNDTYTNSYNGQQAFKLIFPGTTDAANL